MPSIRKILVNYGLYFLLCSLPVIGCALLYSCTEGGKTQLDRIKERGELIVVTRNGPTSYYIQKNHETGLEYELAKKFADSLGVHSRHQRRP